MALRRSSLVETWLWTLATLRRTWNFAERAGQLRAGEKVDTAIALEEDPYSLGRGYAGWGMVLKDVRPLLR